MIEIELDGRRWRSRDDAFEALLKALRAPDWHGHNLDALNDSLRGDDLNAIKAPVAVRVTGLEEATPVARVAAWRIGRLFAELSNDGVGVAWSPAVEGTVAEGESALETFRAAALEKERRVEVERFPAIVVFPQSSPGGTPGFQALSTSRDAWPLPSRRVAPMFSTPNH